MNANEFREKVESFKESNITLVDEWINDTLLELVHESGVKDSIIISKDNIPDMMFSAWVKIMQGKGYVVKNVSGGQVFIGWGE